MTNPLCLRLFANNCMSCCACHRLATLSEIVFVNFRQSSIAVPLITSKPGHRTLCWLFRLGLLINLTIKISVSSCFPDRFLAEEELTDIERSAAIDMCIEFHTSTQTLSDEFFLRLQRKNYVTPTSYLELIQTFRQLLNEKRMYSDSGTVARMLARL